MSEINNPIATHIQKYENYREQFIRLKKALDSKFFLEAIFIEYTIIEDRTGSILRDVGKWDSYLKKRVFYYCAEYNCEICGSAATVNDYGGVDYYDIED